MKQIDINNYKTIERCFNQIFKTQADCLGDCYTCKPDKLNEMCEKYNPVKVIVYEVGE